MARRTAREGLVVEGLGELEAALADLGKALSRGVLRRTLLKVARPTVEAAQAKAPRDSGQLAKSISAQTRAVGDGVSKGKAAYAGVMRSGGTKAEAVAALRTARRGAGESFAEVFIGPDNRPQAIFAEFGTAERFHKSGKSVGQALAQPFLRPAWDETRGAIPGAIAREIWPEIQRTVARRARRQSLRAERLARDRQEVMDWSQSISGQSWF